VELTRQSISINLMRNISKITRNPANYV